MTLGQLVILVPGQVRSCLLSQVSAWVLRTLNLLKLTNFLLQESFLKKTNRHIPELVPVTGLACLALAGKGRPVFISWRLSGLELPKFSGAPRLH